jgi:hypothetical protein
MAANGRSITNNAIGPLLALLLVATAARAASDPASSQSSRVLRRSEGRNWDAEARRQAAASARTFLEDADQVGVAV